jgi:hypothetical protein
MQCLNYSSGRAMCGLLNELLNYRTSLSVLYEVSLLWNEILYAAFDIMMSDLNFIPAEHQSELLEKIKSDYPLSDKELQVLMRGRNSVTRSKNRRNPAAYQDSTSFEALVGYLYISDQQRCTDLLNWLDTIVDHD